MSGCTLLHEFGKNTGCIGIFPLVGHGFHHTVTVRAACPEWDYNIGKCIFRIFINTEPNLFAGIENLQILQRMHRYFRISRCCFGCRATFANYQFHIVDADVFVRKNVFERFGTLHRNGVAKSNMVFVEFGHQYAPFGRNAVYCI